jgi:hypothetical protein
MARQAGSVIDLPRLAVVLLAIELALALVFGWGWK